ncbi:hairy-related 3 [Cheilinus undulatus]|uniref:hairy-related 3 n=1 Tax=Cheilinus undulatus TaxID=241271 RepID=UPI001BD21545|nr:hairy-related 3 [Cheilinus undulatus]
MVATTDCAERSKTSGCSKVSKPLMEKKRRARINKCLDQLQTLLESFYSSSIRKRKLEKADILELTVKHLRNLQKVQSCTAFASDFSDYQAGFRSCMENVNQYLMMADNLHGNDRWMLSQLTGKVCRSGAREEVFSTKDSGTWQAEPLLPSAAAPEDIKAATCRALKHYSETKSSYLPSRDAQQQPCVTKQEASVTAPAQNTHENSHKKLSSVSHRNEAANTQENVWRPW